ncbi:MAG: aminotransferase class V-fold PLP-dependent enzyme, partial [Chloroflexota bacterium]
MNTTKTDRIDVLRIRDDFPILKREIAPGIPLVYLDSTATSQKPLAVIRAMNEYYERNNANIHRGVHTLAEEATAQYEAAREKIARFIGARKSREVIFVRNTTEAINLVAFSWGRKFLQRGDRILLTEMEHHSNLVPWQMLAQEKDLFLDFIPVTNEGLLDLREFEQFLEQKPKIVA